ncbi:MAG: hypothetical protein ACUVWN_06240, partial [bacterium]
GEMQYKTIIKLPIAVINGIKDGAIIANVFAFHFHQAQSIADRKKMNRCFPEKQNGTSYLNIMSNSRYNRCFLVELWRQLLFLKRRYFGQKTYILWSSVEVA